MSKDVTNYICPACKEIAYGNHQCRSLEMALETLKGVEKIGGLKVAQVDGYSKD